ncbi:MAG: hypothetical protein K2J15_02340, partial [Muribaculaceae bacterium]|nr:hypothetical protein [Muribaculaceae bacterium]
KILLYAKRNRKFSSIIAILLPAISFIISPLHAAVPGEELPEDFDVYNLFDNISFYDGYKTDEIIDAGIDDGILRFNNYHYAKKLDTDKIIGLGSDLKLEVIIGALCDNYDRLGRVMLAFPKAGSAVYNPEDPERIEIARFITPFMNKNKSPKQAPYIYDIDDIRQVLSDTGFLNDKDVWMEVELFGIPYTANKQIKGCDGRNDVFSATVSLGADATEIPPVSGRISVIPINISKPEIYGNINLNNYNSLATDTLGVTTRKYTFSVPTDLDDAIIYFINTNHGADEEGEEYYRRRHLIYVDSDLKLVYTPGGVSCEPYRYLNTQGNMIYDKSRPDSFWEEYSNWCPGQPVPIRRINLGNVKSGTHSLMIRVPEAEFYGESGDFRPSAFLIGVNGGKVAQPSAVETVIDGRNELSISVNNEIVRFNSSSTIRELRIYSYDGVLIEGVYNPGNSRDISFLPTGHYIITAVDASGQSTFLKYLRP